MAIPKPKLNKDQWLAVQRLLQAADRPFSDCQQEPAIAALYFPLKSLRVKLRPKLAPVPPFNEPRESRIVGTKAELAALLTLCLLWLSSQRTTAGTTLVAQSFRNYPEISSLALSLQEWLNYQAYTT